MLEALPTLFNQWTGENSWHIQVLIAVSATLLFSLLLKAILWRLHSHLEKTRNPWDDAFIKSLKAPITILIWVIGLAFAATLVKSEIQTEIFSAIGPIRDASVIIVIAWFSWRFINNAQQSLIIHKQSKGQELDKTTADAICKLLHLSVIILTCLVMLQTLGYSISGILAFGGIGGIAIGFAAKDLLSNFFGGLMIYLDRPFAVGDWIRSPDRDIEGTVEHIGWRQTRIRTFSKRPLHVPNAIFPTIAVENPSRMSHRRIYETIGIRYDDANKMSLITDEVKQMLRNHPEIDTTQTMIVNFNAFAPSSMDFFVYTFTKTTDWIKFHDVKHDVLLKISEIIIKHNAQIAFPTSTLDIPDGIKIVGQEN